MTRYLALLRGVNVGGKHRLPMADARGALKKLGYADVASYIQSGNLVFSASDAPATAERRVTAALKTLAGFDVPTVVLDAATFAAIRDANPWRDEPDGKACHVVVFAEPVPPAVRSRVLALPADQSGEVAVAGRAIYLHTPAGLTSSKLPEAVGRIAKGGTARNLSTMAKLADLIAG